MKLNFLEGSVPVFRYICVFHQHQAVEKTSACAKLIAPVHETEEELHQAYIDDKKNYDRMMEMWTTDKKILERRYKKEMERSPGKCCCCTSSA
ncbi:hypothetical protein PSK87_08385 [Escherichia coli]|nr:hypothetical protein [Escherichia coli]